MAIIKGNKIVASEVNASAGTNFVQNNIIYASDVSSLYGGTDTIVRGVLIKAEHCQNLGLPGTGGLNGTYAGLSFKDAVANDYMSYTTDADGWVLTFTKTGSNTLNFTSFGKYGSNVDIFLLGGGGAGNKNGLGGSGGFYTTINETLSTGSQTLIIGTGGTTNGGTGEQTSAFSSIAEGGYGGKAHTVNYYYISVTMNEFDNYIYKYDSGWIDDDGNVNVVRDGRERIPYDTYTDDLRCDQNGNVFWYSGKIDGMGTGGYFAQAADGAWYQSGGGTSSGSVKTSVINATRPSDEPSSTSAFGIITVSGSGSDTDFTAASRKGQGGGGTNTYGGSSFGKGGDGLIMIRNHRQ